MRLKPKCLSSMSNLTNKSIVRIYLKCMYFYEQTVSREEVYVSNNLRKSHGHRML
jgi:hypothetical protein